MLCYVMLCYVILYYVCMQLGYGGRYPYFMGCRQGTSLGGHDHRRSKSSWILRRFRSSEKKSREDLAKTLGKGRFIAWWQFSWDTSDTSVINHWFLCFCISKSGYETLDRILKWMQHIWPGLRRCCHVGKGLSDLRLVVRLFGEIR